MLNFKHWIENYNRDILNLKKYLQNRTLDLYNHAYDFFDWPKSTLILKRLKINLNQLKKDYEEGNSEPFDRIEQLLTQEEKEEFSNEIAKNRPAEAPSWFYFDSPKNLLRPNTWLIHFSDYAEDIATNGFKRGVENISTLGLTTFLPDVEKQWPGYNFAFTATSREAKNAAYGKKYGKNAVMFQAAGVQAWHYSDQEHQVMFYGPKIPSERIILLKNTSDYGWCVITNKKSQNRDVAFCGDFTDSINWVIKNHQQYKNIIMGH